MNGRLDIHDIIEQTIQANRVRQRMLLGFAALFVTLGAVVLVWGLAKDSLIAYAGVMQSGLFVPAVLLVQRINHENTALRLLEIPLRRTQTAEEAERVLIDFFRSVYGADVSKPKSGTKRS